jgi:creatinine amidohydrolase
MTGIRVAAATWPRVEEMLLHGATAVLPVGAACKEHGRHLPMNTDQRQVEWITDRLSERLAVVVWPAIAYGYYPVFVDYPGSISLSRHTFTALIDEILNGIEDAGARRIVVLNTGISTIAPLEDALLGRSKPGLVRLINVYSGPGFVREAERVAEQRWGGHADEIETSMMLAIDDARVELALARPAPVRIVRGRFNRDDPSMPNYSPDGVNGDPTLAARWKGERLLAAMLEDVLRAIAQHESG